MPMIVTRRGQPGDLVLPVAPAACHRRRVHRHRAHRCSVLAGHRQRVRPRRRGHAARRWPPTGHAVDWGSLEYSGPLARSPLITEGHGRPGPGHEPATERALQRFRSAVETPELAQGTGAPGRRQRRMRTIPRDDLRMGLEAVVETLFGRIPSIIRPQVGRSWQPEVDSLLEELLSVVDAKGIGTMSIMYHTPPEPTPPPGATPEPAGAVWVHVGAGRLGRGHPGRSGARARLVLGAVRSMVRHDAGRWHRARAVLRAPGRVLVPGVRAASSRPARRPAGASRGSCRASHPTSTSTSTSSSMARPWCSRAPAP